jgi:FtsP/CotA-like multicopper oxidase with cupredoxin domain
MNRGRFVVASAAAAATGAALAADGCSSTVGTVPGSQPPAPSGGYVLKVGYATTRFGLYRFRTRTYNGRIYGPTMHATPGTTLNVEVVNNLPPNPKETLPTGRVRVPVPTMSDMFSRRPKRWRTSDAAIDPMNNPHAFNTTNLHVHGVQTIPHLFDPIGTSDPAAEMIAIRPGERFSYAFPIPPDQPAGLYWYHPHHHGSTDVQISSGMAGLIVVSGPIDQVPEIAAARDIPVIVQTLNVNKTPGKPDHFEIEYVAYEAPPKGYSLGTDYTMLAVNGRGVNWIDNVKLTYTPLPVPKIDVAPGEVVRVRLLNATNFLILPLVLPGMEVYQIAVDGVNFLETALLQQNGTTSVTAYTLNDGSTIVSAPANRNEFLVRAPKKPGTYTLSAVETVGVSFQTWPTFDLVQFVVSGEPVEMGIPGKLPVPTREYPAIGDAEIAVRRTIAFSEGVDTRILTGSGFYINGDLYRMEQCEFRPKVGTAEEWTLTNSSQEAHPLHLHDNSFQVISINGKPLDPFLVCDTILVPPVTGSGADASVVFRVRFKEYPGKTVYHCHITPHEDTGMMQNILMV